MQPSSDEIRRDLTRLTARISAYGDDPVSDAERQSLAKATAYCVEMIRRKYGIISAYYVTAERAAQIMFEQEYGDLTFH